MNSPRFIQFVLILCWFEGYQNKVEPSCSSLAFTLNKAFLKNNKGSGLPASFSAWFLKKNISLATFYWLTKFHCLVTFNSWDIEQFVYCVCLLTSLWHQKFRIWHYLSSQAVFSTWSKSQSKNLNILRAKRAFKMK